MRGELYSLVTHPIDGKRVLEFERLDRLVSPDLMNAVITTGTSVIAHEINNPLEAITNLLYLLSMEKRNDAVSLDYIEKAQYELERISGITKQTLRWSKESVQNVVVGRVGTLFEDVVRLFAGKIRNRQVTVTILGGEEVGFFGVVGQLRQVMANLLSNALDAVPVGGHIWLDVVTREQTIEIEVRNEGSGMSQEVERQLFQPFFSTKGDLGNGLGLYISNEIVERHGGRILVENKPKIGTTMRISLPAAPV